LNLVYLKSFVINVSCDPNRVFKTSSCWVYILVLHEWALGLIPFQMLFRTHLYVRLSDSNHYESFVVPPKSVWKVEKLWYKFDLQNLQVLTKNFPWSDLEYDVQMDLFVCVLNYKTWDTMIITKRNFSHNFLRYYDTYIV